MFQYKNQLPTNPQDFLRHGRIPGTTANRRNTVTALPGKVVLGALTLRDNANLLLTDSVARLSAGQLPVDTEPVTGNRHVARAARGASKVLQTVKEGPLGRTAESIGQNRVGRIAGMAGAAVVGATVSVASVKYGIVPPSLAEKALIGISGPASYDDTLGAVAAANYEVPVPASESEPADEDVDEPAASPDEQAA